MTLNTSSDVLVPARFGTVKIMTAWTTTQLFIHMLPGKSHLVVAEQHWHTLDLLSSLVIGITDKFCQKSSQSFWVEVFNRSGLDVCVRR